MDSGASAICMKFKASIPPSTCEILQKPISLGGIASGLEIIGQGKTAFEFISTKGKTIRVIRDAFFCPDLPVDSVSPQKLVRNDNDCLLYTF